MVDFWGLIYSLTSLAFFFGAGLTIVLIYFAVLKDVRERIKWLLLGTTSGAVSGYILASLLKLIFKIPRPCIGQTWCPSGFSFPSEHATVLFSLATFLIFYKRDWKLSIIFLVFAGLVSVSRVVEGVHTVVDIAVGAVLGVAIGYLVHANRENLMKLFKFI